MKIKKYVIGNWKNRISAKKKRKKVKFIECYGDSKFWNEIKYGKLVTNI